MKFLLLSLVLNLVILFLPIFNFSANLKGGEIETISMEITINEIYSPIVALDSPEVAEVIEIVEVFEEESEAAEVIEIVEAFEVEPEAVEIVKEKSKVAQKPKKIEKPKTKKVEKKSVATSHKKPSKPTTKNITKKSNASSGGGGSSKIDFCKENVGFRVLNPKTSYEFPKKAKRLRLKGSFRVDVSFKLDGGVVNIINVKSDNKVFEEDAIRHTKELKFEILDKKVSSCVITKPFIFVSN
ncbi:MAG: hypothetical protein GX282_03840 [Campylobacteraceae bacterium]|nr:hypothetical protein [Campylobacteraceae bacterium]